MAREEVGMQDVVMSEHETYLEPVRRMVGESGQISKAVGIISDCVCQGGTIFIFGNGGSAADASHFAGEMMGWFEDKERGGIRCIALTADSSVMTAIANDEEFLRVFSRQVETLMVPEKDVAIGITTSGKSGNVQLGLKAARVKKAGLIALTGRNGMEWRMDCSCTGGYMDAIIRGQGEKTSHIQVCHSIALHIIAKLVEEYGKSGGSGMI